MSKDDRRRGEGGELAAAALALEQELRRFEDLAAGVARAPLSSQKGLEQAARATSDAAASQSRFAEHLKSLVEAVNAARDRQAAAAATINARVVEIDACAAKFLELRERFAQLGARAAEVNVIMQRAAAVKREPGDGSDRAELRASIAQALEGLGAVVEGAQQLMLDARDAEAQDLSREAESLRQQVLSARNKLGLLQKHLDNEGPPPS
ncbi:hypothetical protein [Polyangium sp. 6x1]|uniref:hypothetical protein n=1 Tax=Polyangium sp. 6x1 TaxID=3042689 RepID=UPI0024826938|nr:hypothetical protein [Polyangium sp. 6x1]MDI1442833.1 hypothetical protein [Polyangium sp. 6x1]